MLEKTALRMALQPAITKHRAFTYAQMYILATNKTMNDWHDLTAAEKEVVKEQIKKMANTMRSERDHQRSNAEAGIVGPYSSLDSRLIHNVPLGTVTGRTPSKPPVQGVDDRLKKAARVAIAYGMGPDRLEKMFESMGDKAIEMNKALSEAGQQAQIRFHGDFTTLEKRVLGNMKQSVDAMPVPDTCVPEGGTYGLREAQVAAIPAKELEIYPPTHICYAGEDRPFVQVYVLYEGHYGRHEDTWFHMPKRTFKQLNGTRLGQDAEKWCKERGLTYLSHRSEEVF